MRKIVYYVATSIDGYIAGPNDEIDKFSMDSPLIEPYLKDLMDFDTVIMGRRTYEFGYQFGLESGQPAYAHMEHYIFSNSLAFKKPHKQVHIVNDDISIIKNLKKEKGTDIYVCGGGVFAGWLLDYGLIDILRIKLNPFLFGDGIPMFGKSKRSPSLDMIEQQDFQNGYFILTYNIKYE